MSMNFVVLVSVVSIESEVADLPHRSRRAIERLREALPAPGKKQNNHPPKLSAVIQRRGSAPTNREASARIRIEAGALLIAV